MSYPLHKVSGGSAARTVRTENGFWGLDLAAEPGRSMSRSGDTQNLIWDGDALKMRPGYSLAHRFSAAINGIYNYKGSLIVHAGAELYEVPPEGEPLLLGAVEDAPSFGVVRRQQFVLRSCTDPYHNQWSRRLLEEDLLFVSAGTGLWFYDGAVLRTMADSHWGENFFTLYNEGIIPEFAATVPVVAMGRSADGIGGDRDPRGDNRLSQFRSECYYLPEGEKLTHFFTACPTKEFNLMVPLELELRDTAGVWRSIVGDGILYHPGIYPEQTVNISIPGIEGGSPFTVDEEDRITVLGRGNFRHATDGFDNVRITYAVLKEPPTALTGATVLGLYGAGGADDVLFLGGSPAAPGVDAFSVAGDFLCFYQTSTEKLGDFSTPVTGYCRLSDGRMAVLKNDPGSSTVFFRSHDTVEVGMTLAGEPYLVEVYPSKTGAQVEGCITPHSVGVAGNEPCFLARTGLYGVRSVSNELTDLNETVRRSIPIDPLLTTLDPALLRSVCWQNYYILAFGDLLLVTDGRRDSSGQLRFMKWKLAHQVTALGVLDSRLYLGASDGSLLLLGESTDDAGTPIEAYWRTPAAETGNGRNLLLRRLWAAVSPGYRARLGARLFRDRVPQPPKTVALHRTDFADWDFGAVSFDGTEEPRWVPLTYHTVEGGALAVEVKLSDAPDLKLWGFRMTYEKGGKTL